MKVYYPSQKYIVFDFETTGFYADTDKVIQMSALKVVKGEVKERFNVFLQVEKPIKKEIEDLTGITTEFLKSNGKEQAKTWIDFADFIKGFALVGHNSIAFDKSFLEKNFELYDLPKPSNNAYIDTAMLYKAQLIEEKQRWYENHIEFCRRVKEIKRFGIRFNLVQACNDLEIDISSYDAHRSDADVEMTNLLYKKLCLNEK